MWILWNCVNHDKRFKDGEKNGRFAEVKVNKESVRNKKANANFKKNDKKFIMRLIKCKNLLLQNPKKGIFKGRKTSWLLSAKSFCKDLQPAENFKYFKN